MDSPGFLPLYVHANSNWQQTKSLVRWLALLFVRQILRSFHIPEKQHVCLSSFSREI